MSNTLVLHIGTPKTGTTALQFFLYENSEELKKLGWSYPNLCKGIAEMDSQTYTENVVYEANCRFLFPIKEKFSDPNSIRGKAWELIKKELENYNVILSEEAFYYSQKEMVEVLKDLKSLYDNVKVVIYLRRQDKYVESLWNHEVKWNSFFCEEFSTWIQRIESVQYLSRLHMISEIVGKENLIVRIYEKEQFLGETHSIASDFLYSLGIEPDWTKFNKVKTVNKRLYGNNLEIKRIFNKMLDKTEHPAILEQYRWFFLNVSNFGNNSEKVQDSYFSAEERADYLKSFEKDNITIAKEYLNREDGKLFLDEKVDYPSTYIKATPLEEEIIRTFVYLTNNRDKQSLLLQIIGDRKLAYFGAGAKCYDLLKMMMHLRADIIVDNSKDKEGTYKMAGYYKVPVVHTSSIEDWSQYFVVVTCMNTDEIEKQLSELGLQKGRDFVLAKEWFGWKS